MDSEHQRNNRSKYYLKYKLVRANLKMYIESYSDISILLPYQEVISNSGFLNLSKNGKIINYSILKYLLDMLQSTKSDQQGWTDLYRP